MEATRILVDDASQLGGASSVEEVIPPVDQYAEEADAFARVVLGESELPYGVDDAVTNMKIIDAIFRSGETGKWESTGCSRISNRSHLLPAKGRGLNPP